MTPANSPSVLATAAATPLPGPFYQVPAESEEAPEVKYAAIRAAITSALKLATEPLSLDYLTEMVRPMLHFPLEGSLVESLLSEMSLNNLVAKNPDGLWTLPEEPESASGITRVVLSHKDSEIVRAAILVLVSEFYEAAKITDAPLPCTSDILYNRLAPKFIEQGIRCPSKTGFANTLTRMCHAGLIADAPILVPHPEARYARKQFIPANTQPDLIDKMRAHVAHLLKPKAAEEPAQPAEPAPTETTPPPATPEAQPATQPVDLDIKIDQASGAITLTFAGLRINISKV